MGKLDIYNIVEYNGKKYIVFKLIYNENIYPIIIDYDYFNDIKNLNKNWHINDKGIVITTHISLDGIQKVIYLHEIIMQLSGQSQRKKIEHINRVGLDNRLENLIYSSSENYTARNTKKLSRKLDLSEYGINKDDIPSYVSYVKEDATHGNRFMLKIGDIRWKSTSSKKVSLKYKLEETKKYLRYIRDTRNDIFENYCMNGDMNIIGRKLFESFIEITKKSGYKNLKNITFNNTDKYITENLDTLTNKEIEYLKYFDPSTGTRSTFK